MTNFDPNMKKKIPPPIIEAGHVLIIFLFFLGFQTGCSYKRCSYKMKKVYAALEFILDTTRVPDISGERGKGAALGVRITVAAIDDGRIEVMINSSMKFCLRKNIYKLGC